jgi:hypothetical protein
MPPSHGVEPATGTTDPQKTDMQPEEEPVVSGTLFLTLILLMLIFGFWIIMYITLLNR